MQFYFSGVSSAAERSILEAAGVTHILVDPYQAPIVAGWLGDVALDSGAYARFKGKRNPLTDEERQRVEVLRAWSFRVCDDTIGDPAATLAAWERQRGEPGIIPVWAWGAPVEHLARYLGESQIVGIGGLVPLMRAATQLDPAGLAMLDELEALCYQHPGRFHIFGINNLDAIQRLAVSVPVAGDLVPLGASGDSSKHLDAGRYGQAIFIHATTGALQATRASRLPFAAGWDRATRCAEAAKAIHEFCNVRPATIRTWDEARELQPVLRGRYDARAKARQRSAKSAATTTPTAAAD